jgi:anthranilate synthase/aminodeoxychorismate synthase-like glutamine amidotransferase
MRVLVLDNYDSFTFNLVQHLGELGAEPLVFRNDELTLGDARALRPERIVLSPGPGHPETPRDFGVCLDVLRELSPEVPTLGVCLGHQGIAAAFGGKIIHAERPVHGKPSQVHHDGRGVFRGLPQGFRAARYHSLLVDPRSLPRSLEISAVTDGGEVMGLRHTRLPIEGVQFHPESILTECGKKLLANFLGTRRPEERSRARGWEVGAP